MPFDIRPVYNFDLPKGTNLYIGTGVGMIIGVKTAVDYCIGKGTTIETTIASCYGAIIGGSVGYLTASVMTTSSENLMYSLMFISASTGGVLYGKYLDEKER